MNSPYTSFTPTRSPARSLFASRSSTSSSGNTIPHSRQSPAKKKLNETNRYVNYNPEKEPIKAYLRIRPKPENYQSIDEPYIEIIDDVEVSMTPPENSNAYRTRHRTPEKYRFTKVFQDSIDQETFFNETALSLVKDVLDGNNALVFAYGVTNSGKTYSVMGKQDPEHAGLLPRSLNIMLSSIQEYKSETKIKPVMHSLVQAYENDTEENRHTLDACNIQETTQRVKSIEIDPNFEYGIWVSFVEVYNEQIFDLLDTTTIKPGMKRTQLHLKYEQRSGNKYVADMNIVKVKSFHEANAIMRLGQQNRQVFSTLMNQTSSRSHSIFTIHVVRCPIDGKNFVIEDPSYATVSKLSIVDLAGSERFKNTNSTGQRLKEAGNINNSLMVLGQCMEVLRVNQLKVEMGKNPSIVPFRHSKLTELFKSTFEGDGKAVIIVNVNPFDTGFDENSHVMKFAAVAKDVTTWRQTPPKFDLHQITTTAKRLRDEAASSNTDDYDETMEEEEEEDEEDVDDLIAQLDDFNSKWMDAETRAVYVECDIFEQMHKELQNQLQKMQEMLALNEKSDLEEASLQTGDNGQIIQENHPFLSMLFQRQQFMVDDINNLKSRIQDFDTTKQSMLDKISELEKENQQEKEKSEYLFAELHKKEKELSNRQPSPPTNDRDEEDEGEDDVMKENDDPTVEESFNHFLSLRKQLRRSIFKREELCKDADTIMNQVEQFDGVTFDLAKETKMGKLLKLIAQEEFEKDPYQIRNRAVKLFKRYAQLPSTTSTTKIDQEAEQQLTSKRTFSSMTMKEQEDIENLRAENVQLKHRIKSLNKGKKRLRNAFERSRSLQLPQNHHHYNGLIQGRKEMIDKNEDKVHPQFSLNTTESTQQQQQSHHDEVEDYESDINELLKQNKRHKRRRKLRTL